MMMKRPNWMYSCEKASFYIVVSESRTLSLSEKSLLLTHLMMCKFCRRFKTQSKQVNQMARHFVSPEKLSELQLQELEKRINENS